MLYAGTGPVTGKRSYLRERIKGSDEAAFRRANSAMNRLLAQVADQSTETSATLGQVIEKG